jgi:protein-S-isoprenylcysteine O-methyltransferase Ste14
MMSRRGALHDRWVWAQLALLAGIGVLIPTVPRLVNLGPLDPLLGMLDARGLRLWIGIPLLGLGLALAGWGVRSLGASLTPSVQPLPDASLVESGPYRRVRHPIYLGIILTMAGYAELLANWRLAFLTGWILTLFFDAKATREERYLTERFPEYSSYRRGVPKLWPWGKR